MPVMYCVQGQPREGFMTMKPPIEGAIRGPQNTTVEKTVMALPR